MSSRLCVLCTVYRPRAQPRLPERPPVCDGDRSLLDRHLAELPDLHRRLAVGGAGQVRARSQQPRVSGSRPWSAPASLDLIDLSLPARPAARRLLDRGALVDPDQVGHLSVATILDTWVRDWRARPFAGFRPPTATVDALVGWLRRWLDGACDEHPRIGRFATEIRELRGALRRLLRDTDRSGRAIEHLGASCPRCDLRGVLMWDMDDVYIQCGGCGALYTDAELTNEPAD
ncbi:hypothetical protein JQS43_02440 [Natronosporangium hydrolyticum]|uniref:Uncharacterized protein n=1 Tax=Natronosporangium hydrolyticum TaxID=2811111 RepID=A0A895YIP8_9ACTN|nr:hypothetical protein [Natronosporangium hydrolyticum]QSB15243.1 hypothetical protein JQS43_02440 [Natronosporangium hydrolyticum]